MLTRQMTAARAFGLTYRWLLGLMVLTLAACAHNPHATYEPTRAQHGKDVMWIPTSDPLIAEMLNMAQVNANDLVYDLGAGDGRIAIAAARQYGARAVGIEYNPQLASYARENVQKAGVADKVTIITGDIFKEDFSHATVVTLYLLESLNIRLKPQILAMKPGTRVVSNSFSMGGWIADNAVEASNGAIGLFWIVPARMQGRWRVQLPGLPESELAITQKYQFIEGRLTSLDGATKRGLEGRLRGSDLTLTYVDLQGRERQATVVVSDTDWQGQLTDDPSARVTAQRISP